jgi:CDP-diacylglycerol--serine O-phosphatidyltransferase
MEYGRPFIIRCIPTLLSLLAIWLGVSAIKYSLNGSFSIAATLLLSAAFLDGIDGRIARALNVSSDFGAQIDSLADNINFGVSPAFIMYFWKMNEFDINFVSWSVVLLLISCMTIRLARFNADLSIRDLDDPLVKYFFVGMPAPAVAAMVILPLVLSFQLGEGFWSTPIFVIMNTSVMALFAASKIPTPCFKHLHLTGVYNIIYKATLYTLIALLLLGFVPQVPFTPWFSLTLLGIVYFITILIAIYVFLKILNLRRR